METGEKLAIIKRRTRRRLVFSLLSLVLYFSFVVNWLPVGGWLADGLGTSLVNGSLLMFVCLVSGLVLLELLFLLLNRASSRLGEEH